MGSARREAETVARVAARAKHMMGSGEGQRLSFEQAVAWEGLLEVSRRLRRDAEEALIEGHDLTISMLGITGRLALAPACTLRQTVLAEAMGLSLSRVSRVIDVLEQRGLVERLRCPSDARATDVRLTPQGAALTSGAQAELLGHVQRCFLDRLSASEVQTLASVFSRLVGSAPEVPGAGS
jgi:DNA-binding MarR family transcriptional regulator